MAAFFWILLGGILMSGISLIGGLTLAPCAFAAGLGILFFLAAFVER
jgi:hypothetical protein